MLAFSIIDEIQQEIKAGLPNDTEPREVLLYALIEGSRPPLRTIGKVAEKTDRACANC